MYRDRIKKTIAVATAAGMMLSMTSVPAAGAYSADVEKEETVYIFTDASGKQKSLLVSDWLKNSGAFGTVRDSSRLSNIENVKGDEPFVQDGSSVTWTPDGKDIYYQGQISDPVPVSVKITYTLDGREADPQELAGASGHLKIRYDYTNIEERTAKIAGRDESIYVPFAVISGCMFTDGCASNVSVSGGKVLEEGGNVTAVGVAFPGLEDSLKLDKNETLTFENLDLPDHVEVEADVQNFSLALNMTLVLDDMMDEVLEQFDAKGDLQKIRDDVDKLETASSELAEGAEELNEGMTELDEGAENLGSGVNEYTGGVDKAADGAGELKSGSEQLAAGAKTLAAGAGTLSAGAGTLNENTGAMTSGADRLNEGVKSLKKAVGQIAGGMKTLYKGTGDLKTGAGELAKGTKSVSDAVSSAGAGAETIREGAQGVDAGVGKISDAISGNEQLALLNTQEKQDELKASADKFAALQKGLDLLSQDPSLLLYDLTDADNRIDALITVAGLNGSSIDKETLMQCIAAAKLPGDRSLQTALIQIILEKHPDIKEALIAKIMGQMQGKTVQNNAQNSVQSGSPAGTGEAEAVKDAPEDVAETAAAEDVQEQMYAAASADEESIAAFKETAASKIAEAESEADAAAGSLSSAQSGRQTADENGSSASAAYQAAYDQYAPDVNNLIASMRLTPLTAEADSISTIVSRAETVAGSFQQAQSDYQTASGSYESAASSYAAAIAAYKEAIGAYEEILAQYESALSEPVQPAVMNNASGSTSDSTPDNAPEEDAGVLPAEEAPAENAAVQPNGGGEALQAAEADPAAMQAMIWEYLSSHPDEAASILSQAQPQDIASLPLGGDLTAGDVDNGLVYMLTAAGQQAGMTPEEASKNAAAISQELIGGAQQATDQLQANKSMLMGMAGMNSDQELKEPDAAQKMIAGKVTVSGFQQLVKALQGMTDAFFGENGLVNALGTLKSGTGSLSTGTAVLAEGLKTLGSRMPQLTQGAEDLSKGTKSLEQGASKLNTGITELDKNMPAMKKGSAELAAGIRTAAGAIAQIAQGAYELAGGTETLKQGSRDLDKGTGSLKDGLETLKKNSGSLREGTISLKDGTSKLVKGAGRLSEGMAEFDEEGVGKIVSLFNGDLAVLMDRMEALKDAGDGYNSFAGLADGMEGSVKFIIRSDSITAE